MEKSRQTRLYPQTILTVIQIFHKPFYRHRGRLSAPQCKGNVTIGWHIQFFLRNPVRRTAQKKLRRNADSQPAFHHGHYRVIIPCPEMYIRFQMVFLKELRSLHPAAFFQKHKRVFAQCLNRKHLTIREPVVFRQDYKQFVPLPFPNPDVQAAAESRSPPCPPVSILPPQYIHQKSTRTLC